MKIGDVYTASAAGKNALIGQPITQLFRDAPVRVRAVHLSDQVAGAGEKSPPPAPDVTCQFQSGTQLIAQVKVNREYFVGALGTPTGNVTATFQGMSGLADDDEIFNGTTPAGNLSLTFKGLADDEVIVWDLEVMS